MKVTFIKSSLVIMKKSLFCCRNGFHNSPLEREFRENGEISFERSRYRENFLVSLVRLQSLLLKKQKTARVQALNEAGLSLYMPSELQKEWREGKRLG